MNDVEVEVGVVLQAPLTLMLHPLRLNTSYIIIRHTPC